MPEKTKAVEVAAPTPKEKVAEITRVLYSTRATFPEVQKLIAEALSILNGSVHPSKVKPPVDPDAKD